MLRSFVIDTSVLLHLYTEDKIYIYGDKVISLISQVKKGVELLAPDYIRIELIASLIPLAKNKEKTLQFLSSFEQMVYKDIIKIYPASNQLINLAIHISSKQYNGSYISFYDALFHALALQQNAEFLTLDKKHFHKTKEALGNIALFSEMEI